MTKINTPTVTIGLPVFNGEKHIRQSIESALNQTYTDFELIISDNTSTDETENICTDYAKKDSRIIYIRQEENKGGAFNFNYVLDTANGKYFTWLAHDDYLDKNFVKETVTFLEQHPDVINCACDFIVVDDMNKEIRTEKLINIREQTDWRICQKRFFEYPISNIFFSIYGMYNLDQLRSIGVKTQIFWTGYISATEIPFLARLAINRRIVSLPSTLRAYRSHADSAFSQESAKMNLAIRLLHGMAIKGDQIYVVLSSSVTLTRKFVILTSMGTLFVRRLARFSFRVITTKFKSKNKSC